MCVDGGDGRVQGWVEDVSQVFSSMVVCKVRASVQFVSIVTTSGGQSVPLVVDAGLRTGGGVDGVLGASLFIPKVLGGVS
jgi:hypothetical protein